MIEIIKPTITKEVNADGQYGKFVIEPLERGYGTTLGNCMRRVLLSSLPGAAITSVKIDGILHEFSTIPGVKEDVTEIILNLKRLAVRVDGNEDKRAIIITILKPNVTNIAFQYALQKYLAAPLKSKNALISKFFAAKLISKAG